MAVDPIGLSGFRQTVYRNQELLRPIAALNTRPQLVVRFDTKKLQRLASNLQRDYAKATGKGGILADVNHEALDWVKRAAARNLFDKMQANKRPYKTRSQRLERAIMNKENSFFNEAGFAFLIYSQRLLDTVPYYLAVEVGSRASVGRRIPLLFLTGASGQVTVESSARQLNRPMAPNPRRGNATRARTGDLSGRRGGTFLPASQRSQIPTLYEKEGRRYGGHTKFKTDRIIGPSERARKGLKSRKFDASKGSFVTIKRPVPAYHYARDAARDFNRQRILEQILRQRKNDLQEKFGLPMKVGSR